MAGKDYLASLQAEPDDVEHHGIKGMKWGVRRSNAQLRAADRIRKADAAVQSAKASGKVDPARIAKAEAAISKAKAINENSTPTSHGNIQDHVESSSARYARLAQEAKAGKAHQMTEQDLKFFNARTEALAKINKLNESNPGWLSRTTKTVLQNTAQQQMQSIASGVANKFISDKLLAELNKPESIDQAIQAGAASQIRKSTIEKGIADILKNRK